MIINAFELCPTYETERFIFRLVNQTDTEDLFKCYSDQITLQHTNNDNCNGSFHCENVDVMRKNILSWQKEYDARNYIRWSIIKKTTQTIIGTMELAPIPYIVKFYKGSDTGILRIDLISHEENDENYLEIIDVAQKYFFSDFQIKQITIKAPSVHFDKVAVLEKLNFQPDIDNILPFEDYYILKEDGL